MSFDVGIILLKKEICWLRGRLHFEKQHREAVLLKQIVTWRSLVLVFIILAPVLPDDRCGKKTCRKKRGGCDTAVARCRANRS